MLIAWSSFLLALTCSWSVNVCDLLKRVTLFACLCVRACVRAARYLVKLSKLFAFSPFIWISLESSELGHCRSTTEKVSNKGYIRWPKTAQGATVTRWCPTVRLKNGTRSSLNLYAVRTCLIDDDGTPVWGPSLSELCPLNVRK